MRAWADLSLRSAHDATSAVRACALTPPNPECWRAAARMSEQEALDSLPLWRRSLELDPSNAEALIAAAATLESAGRIDDAEALLLRAATWNALWPPRWSLSS
ncbi:MAG: tetratricopeptide repeat protein, partial [Acidobacteria bacterium]|nr:tetratricopeptide repeat protein [Acidobacteriota bacterium]